MAARHFTGKSPAFQFYPKDFLSDAHVMAMSLTELGAYWKLTCICWNEGSLPADTKSLARLLGVPAGHASKLWPALAPCFKVKDERLTHPRLEVERRKQADYREKQAFNGRKGGRPSGKGLGSSGETQTEAKESSSSPICNLQSASSSAKQQEQEPPALDVEFFELQKAYGPIGRNGSPQAEQTFKAARESGVTLVAMLEALENHHASEQWTLGKVPNMLKWLTERRWDTRLPSSAEVAAARGASKLPAWARSAS